LSIRKKKKSDEEEVKGKSGEIECGTHPKAGWRPLSTLIRGKKKGVFQMPKKRKAGESAASIKGLAAKKDVEGGKGAKKSMSRKGRY